MKKDIISLYEPLDKRLDTFMTISPTSLKLTQGVLCTICEGLTHVQGCPEVSCMTRNKLENTAFIIFKKMYNVNTYKYAFINNYLKELICSHTIYKCFEAAHKYNRYSEATFVKYKYTKDTDEHPSAIIAINRKGSQLTYPLRVVYMTDSMTEHSVADIIDETGNTPIIQPDSKVYIFNSCFAFLTSTILNAGATFLKKYSDKSGGSLPIDILV